jgi:predicted lipoprotein with Yx(FWY)xxD motif
MTIGKLLREPKALNTAAALVSVSLLLAACGSADHSGGDTPAKTTASTGQLTISTANGAEGTYLTDGSGRALYEWVADRDGKSSCMGACAQAWPPAASKGGPTASHGARESDVGRTTRSDGVKQVTYKGHPLYYFAGDGGPGKTTGQGSDGFGAKWWLVAPSGAAITTSSSSGASGGGGNAGGADG